MHFEHSSQQFLTDRAKVANIISYLTGRAKAWATAEWDRGSRICSAIQEFKEGLRKTFDPVSTDQKKARQLRRLKQGKESVCDYAIRFRTLAVESGWNTMALYDIFLKGLATPIQERLLPLDLIPDLDSLITLAIRTDNRLEEFKGLQGGRQQKPKHTQHIPTVYWAVPDRSSPDRCRSSPHIGGEEPMQMGGTRLTQEERQSRVKEEPCFY